MLNRYTALFILGYWLCHSQTYAFSNVLLLNSYHPQYRWTAELTRGVEQALATDIAPKNLYVEFMDERRFVDDPIYHQKLIELLHYKYQQYKPDIVITSDDAAYYFMLEYGEQLFPGIPIIFCGVNVFNPQSIANRKNITGIAEGMEIMGNLELISQLQPDLKKIIMLGDTTGLGLRMVNAANTIKPFWQKKTRNQAVELEIWDNLSLDELYQQVNELPSDTAILMLAIHKDRLGQYFSFEKQLPELSKYSKVPIYGMWGALMIGHGVVGGMMNDPYEHGFNAAKMALSILSGTPISQLPVKNSADYRPQFDYVQLKRFGLEQGLLPKNSVIFNQPISFYQQNKRLINAVIVVLLFLLLLIIVMVRNIRRRITVENELKQFAQQLENTVQARTLELEERNSELRSISQSMKKLAHTDTLTSLKNRRAASKDIPAYLKHCNITFTPFVLAILDIDHFKQINDNFGHQAGDSVLKALAEMLKTSLRPDDRVYRWGGEEFIIALPETSLIEATTICQRLSMNIHEISVAGIDNITVSIGITESFKHDDYDEIVQRADDALYQAKNSGRNQVMIG